MCSNIFLSLIMLCMRNPSSFHIKFSWLKFEMNCDSIEMSLLGMSNVHNHVHVYEHWAKLIFSLNDIKVLEKGPIRFSNVELTRLFTKITFCNGCYKGIVKVTGPISNTFKLLKV